MPVALTANHIFSLHFLYEDYLNALIRLSSFSNTWLSFWTEQVPAVWAVTQLSHPLGVWVSCVPQFSTRLGYTRRNGVNNMNESICLIRGTHVCVDCQHTTLISFQCISASICEFSFSFTANNNFCDRFHDEGKNIQEVLVGLCAGAKRFV